MRGPGVPPCGVRRHSRGSRGVRGPRLPGGMRGPGVSARGVRRSRVTGGVRSGRRVLFGGREPGVGAGRGDPGAPGRQGAAGDQVVHQRGGVGAPLGVLVQAGADHRGERFGHPAGVRFARQDPGDARGLRRSGERLVRGGREHHHRPPGEQVHRRGQAGALQLLGRHVPHGADHTAGRHGGGLDGARDTEVDHPRPVRRQHDVVRLQVPVHHPGRVDRRQRGGRGHRQPQERGPRARTVLGDGPGERGALDVLRGDPRLLRLRIGVQDRRDAEPAHPPRLLHLRREATPHVGVPRPGGVQQLDGRPRAVRPLPQEHLAEPAAPQRAHQPESADRPPGPVHVRPPLVVDPSASADPTGPCEAGVHPAQARVRFGQCRRQVSPR
jgi:hypothetical protein